MNTRDRVRQAASLMIWYRAYALLYCGDCWEWAKKKDCPCHRAFSNMVALN